MTLSGWHRKLRRNHKIHFSIYNCYNFQWVAARSSTYEFVAAGCERRGVAEGAAFESSNSASIFANSSASLKGDTKNV